MSDSWLEHGHGANPTHLDTLFSSDVDRPWPGTPERTSPPERMDRSGRRSSRVAVAVALWIAIVAGTGGAAWAVRDALFPSIGPANLSVWQNPIRETTPPSDVATSTSVVEPQQDHEVAPPEASTPTSMDSGPEGPSPSVGDDRGPRPGGSTEPSVAITESSVDDHGGGRGSNDSGGSKGSGRSDGSGGSGSHGSGSGDGSDG